MANELMKKEEEEAAAKRAEEARIEKVRLDQEAESKKLTAIDEEQAYKIIWCILRRTQ